MVHAFRLKPGADLRNEIEAFVQQQNIEAGWIITCVGSLSLAHLRFANVPNGVLLQGPFEIVSLVGTLSTNGSHLHLGISDSNGTAFGGHLLPGSSIYTTAEIVIGETKDLAFFRENDGTTNWKELQIRNKEK